MDDEPLALRHLEQSLIEFADVEIVSSAREGDAAVEEARRLRPDLIILDVEMPGRNGISVAATLDPANGPEVIIHSAFDRYATAAFDIEALDYLVKPLRPERLRQALTAHGDARRSARPTELFKSTGTRQDRQSFTFPTGTARSRRLSLPIRQSHFRDERLPRNSFGDGVRYLAEIGMVAADRWRSQTARAERQDLGISHLSKLRPVLLFAQRLERNPDQIYALLVGADQQMELGWVERFARSRTARLWCFKISSRKISRLCHAPRLSRRRSRW